MIAGAIGNLNRIFPEFQQYPGNEFLDKKSWVPACRYWLINICEGRSIGLQTIGLITEQFVVLNSGITYVQ
jgi:hypothetical protein